MKKIVIAILLLPVVACLILAVGVAVAVQQNMLSKSDLNFLLDLGKREGPVAVVAVIKAEMYGVDPAIASDPSYGRVQVAGRGHAPWVIRGNLDGRPRVLKLSLRPNIWAAYDTQQQSLYQLWQGDVLFEGAAYDYRHGPQPISTGASYFRDKEGARWFIEEDGQELPARVVYLGHEYGEGKQTAAMNFAIVTDNHRLELSEQPEIIERDNSLYLSRTFTRSDDSRNLEVVFYTGHGDRFVADGAVDVAMLDSVDIIPEEGPNRGAKAEDTVLTQGQNIIADSDCLSCHGENHKIAGPAWAQIAGKFGGKQQDEVISALASSVLKGSSGTWGQVPMPAHPELNQSQAEAAVSYILSVDQQEQNIDAPMNASGQAYTATQAYDILPRLKTLHPSFQLQNLAPGGFEPKVGGMAFRDDGKLVLSSWDKDGAVFLIDPNAAKQQRIKRIAEGLHEPLGITTVGQRLFVLQKQELTELIDDDGDDVIDRYQAFSYDWPSSSNFHSFAFGLEHHKDAFYFTLSICILPGGASCPAQLPTQGKLLRADMNGKVEIVASGFRTPNGIGFGENDSLYITDNQGDWLPASKLVHIERGNFYGSRAVADKDVMAQKETPPVVWLPQDEVGNSPTQPLLLTDTEGPYAGQMIFGDVYNGGIKRVFIEEIAGAQQGAAFHFSAGFQSPINRLLRGPDNSIYVGEVGNPPNWGEYGMTWFGLERLSFTTNQAFEMLAVKAQPDGFILELTQPLADGLTLSPDDLIAKQWFYHPNEQYGGPKYDETELTATKLTLSDDRRSIRAHIAGLQAGYVVYLRLNERLRSQAKEPMWTAEAWYTLNAIPAATLAPETQAVAVAATLAEPNTEEGWKNLFDGQSLSGWRNYGGDENSVKKWQVENGTLALTQQGRFPMWDLISSAMFGGVSGDLIYHQEKFRNFELSLQWKISENGNSGIFYLVADESEKMPWLTGIEMQVLDNDGHDDGKIPTHRAGDLYDLIAAQPETVKAPGEWNEVLIRINDNHIEHWLNGVKVVSVLRGGEQWNSLVAASKFSDMPLFAQSDEGYIVLQDHGDPVWYRNIRVRRL